MLEHLSQSNLTLRTPKKSEKSDIGMRNSDQASKRGLLCSKEAPGGSETYTTL